MELTCFYVTPEGDLIWDQVTWLVVTGVMRMERDENNCVMPLQFAMKFVSKPLK